MEYTRREEAYLYVGGYFDGNNETGTKYKYSQPVVMRYSPDVSRARHLLLSQVNWLSQHAAAGL